jgi:hypothetical protein
MKARASVDRLTARTREFLDAMEQANLLHPSATEADAVSRAQWRMEHAATLEKLDRRIRYGLCRHMTPVGYCVDCRAPDAAGRLRVAA